MGGKEWEEREIGGNCRKTRQFAFAVERRSPSSTAKDAPDRLWMVGRVVGGRKVVTLRVLEWTERVGERRGFPKVGLVCFFCCTHGGTVGSLERPCE